MRRLAKRLVSPVAGFLVLVMTFAWFAWSLHRSQEQVRQTQRLLDEAEARNQRWQVGSERDRAELHRQIEKSRNDLLNEIRKQAARLARNPSDP